LNSNDEKVRRVQQTRQRSVATIERVCAVEKSEVKGTGKIRSW
jgi:hypothetical protein